MSHASSEDVLGFLPASRNGPSPLKEQIVMQQRIVQGVQDKVAILSSSVTLSSPLLEYVSPVLPM